jgi:N-acetylglutamate synthase-like GNAT family acetyltransferase
MDFLSFKIIDLNENLIPSVLEIADQQLGKGYIAGELLTKPALTRVAMFKDIVLGFSICNILTPDQIEKTIRASANCSPKSLFGLLRTIAIRRGSEGFGVGGELAKDGVALLKNQVEKIYAVGYQCKKGINSNGFLTRAGFKKKCKIPDYWKEDSLERNYSCRDCGGPPCRCSAVIFINTLH